MTSPSTTSSRPAAPAASLVDRLSSTKERLRLYALTGFLLFLAAIAARIVDARHYHEAVDFVVSDARGYYMYLPAIVTEGNLRFEKQITEHWGRQSAEEAVMLAHRTPRGYVDDKYPIGVALTIAPPFLLAHGVTLLLHHLTPSPYFAPDGYTIVYQLFDVVWLLAIGWGMMALIDRLLLRYFDVSPAAVFGGILLYWLGSNYVWYYVREPFMVHVTSSFWIVLCVTLIMTIVEKADAKKTYVREMAILGFAFGMVLVCRPTNAFIAPFFLWALVRIHRARGLARFAATVPAAFTLFIPVGIQMAIWYRVSGRLIYYSYYANEGFYFLRPALWQTLFHLHHGLFTWTPLFILSVIGIIWWIRRPNHRIEPLLGCFILSGLLLWYVNSSWWCWWFGGAFGARAWIEIAPLFVMGLVFALSAIQTASKPVRTAGIAFIVFCLMFNSVMLVLYQLWLIPRG